MRYLLSALIIFVLVCCTDETRISVQLSPEMLVLETRQIHKHDFETALRAVIEQKVSKGIRRDELTIDKRHQFRAPSARVSKESGGNAKRVVAERGAVEGV